MKTFDVIIIGGGASGVMTALNIKGKNIAIIDSGKSLAKKIMVTGNGRCNLTNTNMSSSYYNQNIDKFLAKFDQNDTLEFFAKLGLETYADAEGRVYPLSNSAKSVVDVINLALKDKVTAILEQKVIDIKKQNNSFVVTTGQDAFGAKNIVVATGGNSMLDIIENLGVETTSFTPSLVALKCPEIKDLNGIKASNVSVTIVNCNGTAKSERGEVLFKDGGISGIVVFNLSSVFARQNNFNGKVTIDLLPDLSYDKLCEKLKQRKTLNVNIDKFFTGLFLPALSNEIFKKCKLNTNINCNKLTNEQISNLAQTIKNISYNVKGYFDNNQVFSGGVKLSCLDDNLQSKQVPGLYFAGEICDIDGVCGGYNLQWAFTSGKIVGDSLC